MAKYKRLILVILIIVFIVLLIYRFFFSMSSLPKGEFMESFISPEEDKRINVFLCNGGATVDYAVRCEVEDIVSGKARNIYWEYHCKTADIKWIDNENVEINGRKLNVLTDKYDWRNDSGFEAQYY